MGVPLYTRTYLPTLVTILQRTCSYIGTHKIQILKWLPPNSEEALDAAVDACLILTGIVLEVLDS